MEDITTIGHNGKDLTGQVFGRWTLLGLSGKDKWRQLKWSVVCVCGTTSEVVSRSLRCGDSKSCGCFCAEESKARLTGQLWSLTHGHALAKNTTKTYTAWMQMKVRCTNPNAANYKHYGGAGVKVCDRWLHSFENFLEDMGERPEGKTSFGRFADTGNYEPSNCSWQSWAEQRAEAKIKRMNTFAQAA